MKTGYKKISILAVVSTLLFSCDDITGVHDISEETVVVIAPTNEAVVQSNITTFTWEAVEDADDYVLQVVTPNFENASQLVLDSTMNRTSFTKELSPGNYEWRIKAINSGYETEYTANSFSVSETDGLAGNTVILNTPVNNFITNQEEITLSWGALTDATEYRVQILDDSEEIVLEEIITETTMNVTFTEGDFTWQVRAQNDTESTLFSSRNITIDLTEPNTPQLSTPADEASISAGTIDFSWTREDITGSEELDSIYIYTDESLETLFLKDEGNDKTFSTDLEADTYYWNVQAFDAAGNEGEVSETFSLTVN